MREYQDNDPGGWGGDPSRGAAMGRRDVRNAAADAPVRLRAVRVSFVDGDYDPLGTYFGGGKPIYWIASIDDEHGAVDMVRRASSYEDAIEEARIDYPNAVFLPTGSPIPGARVDAGMFLDGAIDAILFCWTDAEGEPLDRNYGRHQLDAESRERLAAWCVEFIVANELHLTAAGAPDSYSAGADFALAACETGCGFDDWTPRDVGQALHESACAYSLQVSAYEDVVTVH